MSENTEESRLKRIDGYNIGDEIFEEVMGAFIISDLDGVIKYVDRHFKDLFKYDDGSDIVGKKISVLFRDINDQKDIISKVKEDGFYRGDITLLKKDGSEFTIPVFASFFDYKDDPNKEIFMNFIDISGIDDIIGSKERFESLCHAYEDIYISTLTVAGKKDLDDIIKTIADEAKKLLKASDCTVYLANHDKDVLEPIYTNDKIYKDEIMAYDIPFGEGEAGKVVETGEARYLNIDNDRDHLVVIPGTEDGRSEEESILTVPLYEKNQVIGVLSLGKEGYNFDEDDVDKIEAFARQTEVAIQRADELNKLERSKKKLSMEKQKIESLHKVAMDLDNCTSEEEIFDITIKAAKDILDFYICTIMIHEDGKLIVKETTDKDLYIGNELSLKEGIYGKTYTNQESYLIDDVSKDRNAKPTSSEFESVMSVPIGKFGVFQTVSDKKNFFDKDDLEITELLISHVKEAIKVVRNRKVIEERKEKLEALHDVASRLERSSSEEETYEIIIDAAEKILNFDMCRIHISEGDKLVVKASSSKVAEKEENRAISMDEGIAGRTFLDNESYIIDDFEKDREAVPFIKEYKSGISVPIGRFGVFQAVSYKRDDFTEEDLELAELLTSHLTESLNRINSEKRERFLLTLLRHDLKNKSQIVRGYLQILENMDIDDEQRDFIEKAKKASVEGQELLSKIGVLKDIEKEKEMKELPVDYFINNSINDNIEIARSNDIEIEFEKSGLKVMGGSLLEELFSNIIENSINHANCRLIRISIEEMTKMIRIKIEDDGVGISDDIKNKVLKRGFKGKKSEGLGIGTFLVKSIAEMYKGYVEVKDSELGGARFDIILRKA